MSNEKPKRKRPEGAGRKPLIKEGFTFRHVRLILSENDFEILDEIQLKEGHSTFTNLILTTIKTKINEYEKEKKNAN